MAGVDIPGAGPPGWCSHAAYGVEALQNSRTAAHRDVCQTRGGPERGQCTGAAPVQPQDLRAEEDQAA